MTIIEADGVETEPVTVDSLNIFAGMSFFLDSCIFLTTLCIQLNATL